MFHFGSDTLDLIQLRWGNIAMDVMQRVHERSLSLREAEIAQFMPVKQLPGSSGPRLDLEKKKGGEK